MNVPFFLVNAFATAPFSGNPAAVCLLNRPAGVAWMQAVARETRQPATAFVSPGASDRSAYGLRWLVPDTELALCGHGTLAAAHVLWETGRLGDDAPARFETMSGLLAARRDGGSIVLDLPSAPVAPTEPPPELLAALGVTPQAVLRGSMDYLVVLASEQEVRDVRPDLARLRSVDTRGVIVTAPATTADADFVSRFFAPSVGIDEDAVTGSAHCALGPYWAARFGRTALRGYQASARGGTVNVRVDGDRVLLGGQAVTVVAGELRAAPERADG